VLKRFAQLMKSAGGGDEAEGLTCADTSGGRKDGQHSRGGVECSARRQDDTNVAGGGKAEAVHVLPARHCTCAAVTTSTFQTETCMRIVPAATPSFTTTCTQST
jgi:hypothetical protein